MLRSGPSTALAQAVILMHLQSLLLPLELEKEEEAGELQTQSRD